MPMKLAMIRNLFGGASIALVLTLSLQAQQGAPGVQPSAGQISQPASPSNNTGAVNPSQAQPPAPASDATTHDRDGAGIQTRVFAAPSVSQDNPYDPILEPPPLPKGKATLIGGIATSVDKVRNHMTIQPFGGGQKVKVFVDERSHIYRNGVETTVLGIHKGDRIYVDTMLDPANNKILAKNVRVVTDTGLAEVRGQVVAANPERGTFTLRDQLSSKPVTFSVGANTSYGSTKGAATATDVQPGALVDVQFSPHRSDRDVARQVIVVAKPGDNYIFSGTVTHLDMRSNSLFVDNKSDDQSYEVHFTPAAVADMQHLRIGSEVTARATFDGKQYKADNIRIDNGASDQTSEQSKAQ